MPSSKPIQSAAVVGALQNASFRTLAFSSAWLSFLNSDRDAGAFDRSVKTPSDQTTIVRRRVAHRLHVSDRRAGHAAYVCKCFARDLSRDCRDVRGASRVRLVLVRLWLSVIFR